MARPVKSQPRPYTVLYNSESHWGVLTQMNGSSWPRVFPYCLLNVLVMLGLTYFHGEGIDAIKISDQGHNFVTMVMYVTAPSAFLVASDNEVIRYS